MKSYSIVLADDHPMLRQGIRRIIEESSDMVVVGEASDGLELLKLLKKNTPAMVILDISMPGIRGIEAAREIKTSYPQVKVLILTMHKEKGYLQHALSARADGYLLKEDSDTELFCAIEAIRKGEIYLSPILEKDLKDDLVGGYRESRDPMEESLTTREREVLKLIAEGKSSKDIAELLFISIRTVQHHRASIKKKLKLNRIADLTKYAIRKGYTS